MKRWDTLSAEEKNRLIAEKVMDWKLTPCDDAKLTIYDSGDACCSNCGVYEHINSFEHGEPQPPRYSENMKVAWQVLQAIAARYDTHAEYMDEVLENFKDELFHCSGDEIYPATQLLLDMAKWTPEHICRVATTAFGVIDEDGELVEEVQGHA